MIKILYAASNYHGSLFQLKRFLRFSKNPEFEIKIASYDSNIECDWNLHSLNDCLTGAGSLNLESKNSNSYKLFREIAKWEPNLIISEMNLQVSYIGFTLKIPVWQVSPILLYFALERELRIKTNTYKFIQSLYNKYRETFLYLIEKSNKNYIYSFLSEIEGIPIDSKFEWIRPYYYLCDFESRNCRLGISSNKQILQWLNEKNNSVNFTDSNEMLFKNIKNYNIDDIDSYKSCLSNAAEIACKGEMSVLSDAFYNNISSIIFPDIADIDCIINAKAAEYFEISKCFYSLEKRNLKINDLDINENISFLDEKIINYFN